jgi:hypothetical protein
MVSGTELYAVIMKTICLSTCVLFLLCACEPSAPKMEKTTVVHEIAGAESKFCVPKEWDIQAPSWVPENKPGTPSGFAFEGCWSADGSRSKACELPRAIKTVGVGPKTDNYAKLWQEMPADTFHRSVLLETDTTFEIVDSGSTVVAANKRLWADWYVWHKAVPLRKDAKPTVTVNDELAAVCRLVESVPIPNTRNTRSMFECDRNGVSRDYSFDYSFESRERIPSRDEMQLLDRGIRSAIESWRCK